MRIDDVEIGADYTWPDGRGRWDSLPRVRADEIVTVPVPQNWGRQTRQERRVRVTFLDPTTGVELEREGRQLRGRDLGQPWADYAVEHAARTALIARARAGRETLVEALRSAGVDTDTLIISSDARHGRGDVRYEIRFDEDGLTALVDALNEAGR